MLDDVLMIIFFTKFGTKSNVSTGLGLSISKSMQIALYIFFLDLLFLSRS